MKFSVRKLHLARYSITAITCIILGCLYFNSILHESRGKSLKYASSSVLELTSAFATATPAHQKISDPCGPKSPYEDFYDVKYFGWQLKHHLFQASQTSPTRWGRVKPEHTVVDIGCSAGAVLSVIQSAKKYCVEINSYARKYAVEKYNLTTFRCVDELPDNSVDYAYSIAVLEHVEAPILLLRKLYLKMRSGAVLEIQVRNEGFQSASEYWQVQAWSQKKNDMNNHIYTWTPLLLGNMIQGAGFEITEISTTVSAFPPNYRELKQNLTSEQWMKVQQEEGKRQGAQELKAFAKKP